MGIVKDYVYCVVQVWRTHLCHHKLQFPFLPNWWPIIHSANCSSSDTCVSVCARMCTVYGVRCTRSRNLLLVVVTRAKWRLGKYSCREFKYWFDFAIRAMSRSKSGARAKYVFVVSAASQHKAKMVDKFYGIHLLVIHFYSIQTTHVDVCALCLCVALPLLSPAVLSVRLLFVYRNARRNSAKINMKSQLRQTKRFLCRLKELKRNWNSVQTGEICSPAYHTHVHVVEEPTRLVSLTLVYILFCIQFCDCIGCRDGEHHHRIFRQHRNTHV